MRSHAKSHKFSTSNQTNGYVEKTTMAAVLFARCRAFWYNRFGENHWCSNSETRRRRSAISSANHVNIWFVSFTIFLSFSLFRCFYRNTVRPSDAQHNKIPWTSGPMNILCARNFHRSSLFSFSTRIEVVFGLGEFANIFVRRSYLCFIRNRKHRGCGKTLYVDSMNTENK